MKFWFFLVLPFVSLGQLQASHIIHAGDLDLILDSQMLVRPNQSMVKVPQELMPLLARLMSSPGRTFSREEIIAGSGCYPAVVRTLVTRNILLLNELLASTHSPALIEQPTRNEFRFYESPEERAVRYQEARNKIAEGQEADVHFYGPLVIDLYRDRIFVHDHESKNKLTITELIVLDFLANRQERLFSLEELKDAVLAMGKPTTVAMMNIAIFNLRIHMGSYGKLYLLNDRRAGYQLVLPREP